MPILAAEPACFPENLFAAPEIDVEARHWRVAHTRVRQEKSLARQLRENSVPFFLPLIAKRLQIRGKVVKSYLPLFGGYVFVFGDGDEQLFARSTGRVARLLEVSDQQRLWDDLKQVERLIASGVPIRPEDQLAPGAPVEIRSGPLAGLRGEIVRSATGSRFIVKVDFIQRGASVMLDESALARLLD